MNRSVSVAVFCLAAAVLWHGGRPAMAEPTAQPVCTYVDAKARIEKQSAELVSGIAHHSGRDHLSIVPHMLSGSVIGWHLCSW